mmetsp:Transcript_20054/g.47817  ORF Transcript_20054/g.47817 Transcript_20054/m.47817 type:complete len:216 (+) Transcript_20054:202-849(+)
MGSSGNDVGVLEHCLCAPACATVDEDRTLQRIEVRCDHFEDLRVVVRPVPGDWDVDVVEALLLDQLFLTRQDTSAELARLCERTHVDDRPDPVLFQTLDLVLSELAGHVQPLLKQRHARASDHVLHLARDVCLHVFTHFHFILAFDALVLIEHFFVLVPERLQTLFGAQLAFVETRARGHVRHPQHRSPHSVSAVDEGWFLTLVERSQELVDEIF